MSVKALYVGEKSTEVEIEGEDLAVVCVAGEHEVYAGF